MECESPFQPPSISAQLRQRLSMSSRTSMLSGGGGVAWGPDPSLLDTSLQQSQSAPLVGSARSLKQASCQSLGSMEQSTASNTRPVTAEIPQPVSVQYCMCRGQSLYHLAYCRVFESSPIA